MGWASLAKCTKARNRPSNLCQQIIGAQNVTKRLCNLVLAQSHYSGFFSCSELSATVDKFSRLFGKKLELSTSFPGYLAKNWRQHPVFRHFPTAPHQSNPLSFPTMPKNSGTNSQVCSPWPYFSLSSLPSASIRRHIHLLWCFSSKFRPEIPPRIPPSLGGIPPRKRNSRRNSALLGGI